MLDRQLIRRDPELVRQAASRKGIDAPVDEFLSADAAFREAKLATDQANAEMNRVSKSIGQLMAQGKKEEAEDAKRQASSFKAQIADLESRAREAEKELERLELLFPNLPHPTVPDGKDADDNVVIRAWGEPRGTTPAHYDISAKLGLIDFERGVKIAGSGFIAYLGMGARLQRALIAFMMDLAAERGYQEVLPPFVINAASLIGTGNLPKFEDDLYKTADGWYLTPTAEVPVTNLYRDDILEAWQLPIRHCAYTPCFRREAGAAGRETRGIQRVHQFDKVELVKFVLPETSYDELETLTSDAEAVLQALELPYRVIELCAGDLGDKGAKCYDVEVWSPGEQRYLEVSSCTNFEAFQARRANIKFRRAAGEKPEFVHTLNGSGTALPRVTVAVLENGWQEDGTVEVPTALRPYMRTDVIEPYVPDPA